MKKETVGRVVGGAAGAGIGAYIGGKMGIAALGTAIAGTWPILFVGLLAGGVIGNEVSKRVKHKTPDSEPENNSRN